MWASKQRRHPVQTFQFWFTVLICFGVGAAWKLDFFVDDDVPSDPRPGLLDEPMPPPPMDDLVLDLPDLPSGPSVERALAAQPFPHPNAPLPENAGEMPPQVVRTAEREILTANTEAVVSDPGAIVQVRSEVPAELPEKMPAAEPLSPVNLVEADQLLNQGEDVAAHRLLSSWYWQRPEERDALRSRLTLLSRRIYFQPEPHYLPAYKVKFGERLEEIAKQYHVPWEYLARLNRVEPEKLQAGQSLKVLQGPFSAVVDLSDFELTVHAHGYYVIHFPIGIGRDHSSPLGMFVVTDKVADPDYYGPQGVIRHDDPANPLGEHWLAINDAQGSLQGYGIHGTIDPASIGKAESQGCLRLRDADIAALFNLLSVGSEVVIRE